MTAYKTPVARRSAALAGALAKVSPMWRYAPAARRKHWVAAVAPSVVSGPVDVDEELTDFPMPLVLPSSSRLLKLRRSYLAPIWVCTAATLNKTHACSNRTVRCPQDGTGPPKESYLNRYNSVNQRYKFEY